MIGYQKLFGGNNNIFADCTDKSFDNPGASKLRKHFRNSFHYLQQSTILRIEKKGMTFDHDFGNSLPLFSFLFKKERRRKGKCKNRDQKSCLSARSIFSTYKPKSQNFLDPGLVKP